jgi:hypothetical protein
MSRVRERHRQLREALEETLRDEDEIVRPEEPPPTEDEERRSKSEVGPEVEDLPLGVPAERADRPESPGFPRGDPTHG